MSCYVCMVRVGHHNQVSLSRTHLQTTVSRSDNIQVINVLTFGSSAPGPEMAVLTLAGCLSTTTHLQTDAGA